MIAHIFQLSDLPEMESLFLTILLLLLLPFCTTAQQACSNSAGNYTADSTYRRNLVNVLTTIAADDQSDSGFYNFSSGQGPDRVNAIGLCRGDLGPADCRGCITNATRRVLVDCPNQKEAVGWYDNCLIRYSNRTLYGLLGPTRPSGPTYYWNNVGDAPDPAQFNAALLTLLTRLQTAAASGSSVKKYAAGRETQGFVTIYGLVQCSPDLSRPLCEDCLTESFSQLPSCCEGKVGGVIRNPICEVRYETYRFVPDTEPLTISPPSPPSADTPPPSPQGVARSKTTSRIVAIVVPIVSAAVLGVILFCCRRRLKRSRIWTQRSSQNGTRDEIGHEGSLQFDFDTIRTATDDFADGSKLGEGGFGAVYKGTLPNGQDVAVKRLDKDSGQGDLEFKNEVRLVAKLQHRNLVRLLGFCLEGRERLLIYEFVPNVSLDHFLFDQEKRVYLNWERRHKIIGGIARGLVYLHEDSRLRIIHRDLKASNILLDADMNPKIADFGMARLFDMDETQGNTSRIVGTYGYMAPEYLMHGQFSTKSDVFSFGVLVLEIVSGQKNISRGGSSGEYLLSYVWKNWNAGTYSNVIDPSLENVPGNEIVRCIHIGLLCVQENINDRPPMTLVALMLTSNSMSLKLPSKPAFFIHTGTNSFAGRSFSSEGYGSSSREVTTGSSPSTEALPLSKNEVSITQLYPR